MATKLNPDGLAVAGTYEENAKVTYALAKALFGADENGVVTIPDDLTTEGFDNDSVVAEVNAKA